MSVGLFKLMKKETMDRAIQGQQQNMALLQTLVGIQPKGSGRAETTRWKEGVDNWERARDALNKTGHSE